MEFSTDKTASFSRRVLIICTDGLRPDSVDPELMPTYAGLIDKGTLFTEFYTAYPPHTRVSVTTLTTGVYPGQHGVMSNLMFIPGFHEDSLLQTGNDKHLLEFMSIKGGPFILSPTLGDRLHEHGKRLAISASSSPGASLLWNLNHPEQVINPSSNYGEPTLMALHEQLGDVHDEQSSVKLQRAIWATRALIDVYLADQANQVMVLWLSEPDSSQHDYGLGSPEAKSSLRAVDHCVGQVLEAVECLGLSEQLDILLISDHGHSAVDSQGSLKEHVDIACRELAIESKFIVTGDYIYISPETRFHQGDVIRLAGWLQNQDWCDILFSGHPDLVLLPGVLPIKHIMGTVHHDRAPLLVVSTKWSAETNIYGVPGTAKTLTSSTSLLSTHGAMSPFDLNAFCLGYGPSFAEGRISRTPCGIVDVAPTVCYIIGQTEETGFDGRVLFEGLKSYNGFPPEVERSIIQNGSAAGKGIRLSTVNSSRYFHGTI